MDKSATYPAALSLANRFRKREAPPTLNGSQVVSGLAVREANEESVRWLSDVACEIDYARWASRMTIQNFMRTRQLALQDLFEDISEEQKATALEQTVVKGTQAPTPEQIRAQAEYEEIKTALLEGAETLAKPLEGKEWIEKRAGVKARRHFERSMRDTNVDTKRDVVRAAQTVIEIETPKASRIQPPRRAIQFPDEAIRTLTSAFVEVGEEPPKAPEIENGSKPPAS